MNKVIIITRDDKSFCKSTWLSQPEEPETECLYPHYDTFCNRCEGKVFENTMVNKCFESSVARKVVDFGKLGNINFDDSQCFLNSIMKIELEDTKKTPCYSSTQYNDKEITLFFINRTIRKNVEINALPQFLYVICRDCNIDLNDVNKEENILYIHDTEWGVEGDYLLIQNHEKTKDANANEENNLLLDKLKNKFTYMATFQHVDKYGRIFRDILDGKFGSDMLSNKLEDLEEKNNNFVDILTGCENILDKPQQ